MSQIEKEFEALGEQFKASLRSRFPDVHWPNREESSATQLYRIGRTPSRWWRIAAGAGIIAGAIGICEGSAALMKYIFPGL